MKPLVLAAAAICLYAHEVSHRSVTTNKYLLYPTEVLLWGLVAIPATLWQRVHGAHHAHTNGDEDTDRRFLAHSLVCRNADGTTRVDYLPVTITRWPPAERVYGKA